MHPQPEWAPQRAVFTAFPSAADLWEDDLAPARDEVAALVRALGAHVPVHLLAHGAEALDAAGALAEHATVHPIPFGDIWLRDTGPVFRTPDDARGFTFNGWGGKYDLPHDDRVADAIAEAAGAPLTRHALVLEGGAIDHDGTGLVATTEQCALNPNRGGVSRAEWQAAVHEALGFTDVLWLGDGLHNDHTDGHIDNLARFVAPGLLAVPEATTGDDPNRAVFDDAAARARAHGLQVARVPSVGAHAPDGDLVPASYMNWVVANGVVAVPTYGAPNDDAAVAAFAALFPQHLVVGLRSNHILSGGGSFHCITQQQPA
jgi:agmatine deiminase